MGPRLDGNRKAIFWVLIIALPFFYLASIGPACTLLLDHHQSSQLVYAAYLPIWQLSRFPTVGKVTAGYLNLWGSSWKAQYGGEDRGVVFRGR